MSSNLEHFMHMAINSAYLYLQHYVCHDYKTSERRNGMGEVHTNIMPTGFTVPEPKMDDTEDVKKPSEKPYEDPSNAKN